MELDPRLLVLAPFVGTAIVWILSVLINTIGIPKPSKNLIQAIVFVVSVALVVIFTPVELPPFSADPLGFLLALSAFSTFVFKAAQEIYDHIWKPIQEWFAKATGIKVLAPRS